MDVLFAYVDHHQGDPPGHTNASTAHRNHPTYRVGAGSTARPNSTLPRVQKKGEKSYCQLQFLGNGPTLMWWW
jgi:hypothetical protein